MRTLLQRLTKTGNQLTGRAYFDTTVTITKIKDTKWEVEADVAGDTRKGEFKTRKDCITFIRDIGSEQVKTTNILNPAHGEFDIDRASKNTCCDPATETYHSM